MITSVQSETHWSTGGSITSSHHTYETPCSNTRSRESLKRLTRTSLP
jgi:hypothetical protein